MIQTTIIPSTAAAIPVIKERKLCHVQPMLNRFSFDNFVMTILHTYDNFTQLGR